MLEVFLFVRHTGCRWRSLPGQTGLGSRAHRRGVGYGLGTTPEYGTPRLHQAMLNDLSEASVLDWSRAGINAVSVRATTTMS